MQRRDAVDGLEAAARGHHIEAVSAVAGDVEVVFRVAVLHHHDEPCPAVGQVVAGHALTALRAHERTRSVTIPTTKSNAMLIILSFYIHKTRGTWMSHKSKNPSVSTLMSMSNTYKFLEISIS